MPPNAADMFIRLPVLQAARSDPRRSPNDATYRLSGSGGCDVNHHAPGDVIRWLRRSGALRLLPTRDDANNTRGDVSDRATACPIFSTAWLYSGAQMGGRDM